MFGWFRRKSKEPVVFPGNEEAFEFACNLKNQVLLGALIPALVLEQGKRNEDGQRTLHLRLAVKETHDTVWAAVLARSCPETGDFVGFRVVKIAADLPPGMNLIGYVAATLEPVFVPGRGWRIKENLVPPDIKPELHM